MTKTLLLDSNHGNLSLLWMAHHQNSSLFYGIECPPLSSPPATLLHCPRPGLRSPGRAITWLSKVHPDLGGCQGKEPWREENERMGIKMGKDDDIRQCWCETGRLGQTVSIIGDAIKGIHEAACMSGVPSDWHHSFLFLFDSFWKGSLN